MLEFLQENWRWIVTVGLTVVTLLISLFRKKSKFIDNSLLSTLEHLPWLICEAESMSLSGAEKKTFVLGKALSYYLEIGGVGNSNTIIDEISRAIEAILTCPQKKGVSLDEN